MSFPTSENLFKRIKTDRSISSSHVTIGYYDSVLDKYLEKRFSAWKEIKNGGDIPWHRVYYFKYMDQVVWDRNTKTYAPDKLISIQKNLPEEFKIISYNVLSEKLSERKDKIMDYLITSNPSIVCLQEVEDVLINGLKQLNEYELAVTDMKHNNIVFMSKFKINAIHIIQMNANKQALKITICDHNNNDVQFIGLHLTSD